MALQAFGRLVGPELARGLSTALALSSQRCPVCPDSTCAPVVHCAEVHRCPDCVCQGSTRQCEVCEVCERIVGTNYWAFVAIWFFGVIAGIVFQRYCGGREETVKGIPFVPITENRLSAAAVASAKRKALQDNNGR